MAAVSTATQGTDPDRFVTSRRLVLVGGGEHARVVAEAASAAGWTPVGYTQADDTDETDEAERTDRDATAIDLPMLGTDAAFASTLAGTPSEDRPAVVIGFGGPVAARRRAVEALGGLARWAVIVHPSAWVSPSAVLAEGAVVLAGAVVNAGARLGSHAIVNSGAIVEHDVRIGAYAHVAPGATIGGATDIGDDAFVGLGSAVRDHITVGRSAVIGMGAVVVDDVAAGEVVVGVPARPRRG